MPERIVTEAELRFKFDSINRLLQKMDEVEDRKKRIAGRPFKLGVGSRSKKEVNDLSEALKGFSLTSSGATRSAAQLLGGLTSLASPAGAAAAALGGVAAAAVAVAAGLYDAGRRAVAFQAEMAGVSKTTDLSGASLTAMGAALLEMSTQADIGKTAAELAEITETAGTLGIKGVSDLSTFTATMARLAETSDIVGAQGSEQMGKLLAVTKTSASETAGLASAISLLSANFATTEAAVLKTGLEVAKGGASFRLSATDALAFATVLDSVGVEAELGRSSILRLGGTIQSAMFAGGKELEKLAQIAGVTSDTLVQTFKRSSGEGIALLLAGFDRIGKSGGDVVGSLDDIGLSGLRLEAVIPTLAGQTEELSQAMAMAADERNSPRQIFIESARAADTVQRQYEVLKNEMAAMSTEIGQTMLPALGGLVASLSSAFEQAEPLISLIGGAGVMSLADFASSLASVVALLNEGTEFMNTWAREGLGAAFAGAEEIDKIVSSTNSLRSSMLELEAALPTSTIAQLAAEQAGLIEKQGTAAAKATLLREKMEALGQKIAEGSGDIEAHQRRLASLSDQYNTANARAGQYQKGLDKVNAEMAKRKAVDAEAAFEAERLAQIERDRVEGLRKLQEETERHRKELEKLAATITSKYATGIDKAAKSLSELTSVQDKLDAGTIERAYASITKELTELVLESVDARDSFEEFGDLVTDVVATALTAAMEDGTISTQELENALSLARVQVEGLVPLVQALGDAVISLPQGFQLGAADASVFFELPEAPDLSRIVAGFERMTGAQREFAKLAKKSREDLAQGLISEETHRNNMSRLGEFFEAWEMWSARLIERGAEVGGAWGKMISGLGENLEGFSGAFDMLAGFAAQRGDTGTAQWLGAAGSAMQGDWGGAIAGAFAASGIGGGGVSQFGGRMSGNMAAEGAQFGAQFGGWGALIGGIVGSMVKTGADDFHSHMTAAAGYADIVVTQAEGELAEIAQQIEANVESILRDVQDTLAAQLDFSMEGFEIHIREDRVRVVANGIEKVFHSLDEAMDFFLRGVFHANAGVEGLTEEVRNLFENASGFSQFSGDPERLMEAFDLATRLDFETTGIDQEIITKRRREMQIMAEFGLSIDKLTELRNRELEVAKRQLLASAVGMTDFASGLQALARDFMVMNNTIDAQAESDRRRKAELERLLAAEREVIQAEGGGALSRGELARTFREGDKQFGEYMDSVTDGNRALWDAIDATRAYERELEGLNRALEDTPDKISEEEIARAINAGAAAGVSSIASLILGAVDSGLIAMDAAERLELERQIFEMNRVTTIAQLYAAQTQLEAMLAVGQVAGVARDAILSLLEAIPGYIEAAATGTFDPSRAMRGGGGGGRRQKAQEERRRQEEEAARTLAEFTAELRRFELNASTASGTLGDLAKRLDDIAEAARQAAESGASPADVRRFQQLSFQQERERILSQFGGRTNFATESAAVEQQRRDAIEQARLLAQAQSEALGVSFEVLFSSMVEDIDRGAARMQDGLTRAVVDALNLPLEGARREMQSFRRAVTDLEIAWKRGEITEQRYLHLQRQITAQQEAAVGGQALSLLDRYYSEVEGREELRRALEEANFTLELETLRLRFDMLVAENRLTEEAANRIGSLIEFMEANPPDWDAFFAPPPGGVSIGGGGGGFSSASISSDFSNLADAIRDFVHGFNQIEVGRFTQQANDWLKALDDFERDIQQMLAEQSGGAGAIRQLASSLFGITDITQLTAEQLQQIQSMIPATHVFADQIEQIIDVLMAAGDLDQITELGPDRILAMYQGTLETTNEMADRYAAINAEYLDAVNALTQMGATAEQLAQAEEIHQQRLMEFWENALAGFRSLSEELRGGGFGGVDLRSQIGESEARIAELRARIAADPEDFEALQGLEAELRNLLGLQQEFTGGVGPEFDRIVREILGISDQIQEQVVPPELQPALADPTLLAKMDEQTALFSEIRDTMTSDSEQLRALVEINTALLQAVATRRLPIIAQQ